ncbi:MAG: hypothetical protein WCA10_17925 [Terracidiphilus sp.]
MRTLPVSAELPALSMATALRLRRRVAALNFARCVVDFVHLRPIDVFPESNFSCSHVVLVCVSRNLGTAYKSLANIPNEIRCPSRIAATHGVGDDWLGVGINGRPYLHCTCTEGLSSVAFSNGIVCNARPPIKLQCPAAWITVARPL